MPRGRGGEEDPWERYPAVTVPEVVLQPYLTRRVAVARRQRLWAVELAQQTEQTPAVHIVRHAAAVSDLPCQVVQGFPGNIILAFHQHLQLQDGHLQMIMHTSQ